MRKIIVLAVVSIFLVSGYGAFANQMKEDADTHEMQISQSFSNFKIRQEQSIISVELMGTNNVVLTKDHYLVPTSIETYTFPYGTIIKDISCEPTKIHMQSITQELSTAPMPVLSSQYSSEQEETSSHQSLSINRWYDYTIGVGLEGETRCLFVTIQTYPVQYTPSEYSIHWTDSFDILISYEEPKEVLISDETYTFVIISPSEYADELNPLATHKNNREISTKVVTLNEIYSGTYFNVQGRDDAEKIKYFIQSTIENWGTTNVMLVGGFEKIPIRETHVFVNYGEGDAEIFASDLYFADIYNQTYEFSSWDTNENDVFGEYDWDGNNDEVDLYPDVHLGRLACLDDDEVTDCVNKIIAYETQEAYTKDWFSKLIVIGGDTSPGDEDGVDEGEVVNAAVIDIMDGFIPTKCWASEGTLTSKNNINDAFDDGAGFVDFSGHGNPELWATHPHDSENVWIPVGNYRNSHVLSLTNDDMLPIVVTGACSVGKFISDDECFTWSFVLNPDGGGIASVGPSSLSWGYTGSYVTRGLGGKMQMELFKAYRQRGAITFGEMWSRAINNYISGNMDGGDHKVVEQWQPFGDPTLSIAGDSEPPITPDAPTGPSTGKTGETYTYNASTTDPDGDTIYYLFDWGNNAYSEWIGPVNSGVTVQATHQWDADGEYSIRVKAKDDHGVQSEWSDPIIVSMPKGKTSLDFSLFTLIEQILSPFFDFLSIFP